MAGKKMTVKSLTEEVERIKEQLKEIEFLRQKVKDLEKTVATLTDEGNRTNKIDESQFRKCNKCDQTFITGKNLKKHIQEYHPTRLKCQLCDQTFSKNSELETHVEVHQVRKNFKCDVCDKEFYLEWRLQKHMSVHNENTKYCNYFVNRMKCPFEPIGCKFRHEICTVPVQLTDKSEDTVEEADDMTETEDDEEILENQCHLCMKQLGNNYVIMS